MEAKDPQPSAAGTPLLSVVGMTEAMAVKLRSRWLLTAEDVLGASASPAVARALQQFLELDDAAFAQFLANLSQAVPAEARAKLAQPLKLGGGLGLRRPTESSDASSPKNPD